MKKRRTTIAMSHRRISWWLMVVALAGTAIVGAADRQRLDGHVPSAVARLAPTGRLGQARRLNLAIGLPPRDQAGLDEFLRQLYDPASPNFRKYLTPQEFTAKFGPTEKDYESVVSFATAKGFKVTNRHPNRVIVDIESSVADIEKTLGITLRVYQHPTETRTFYAPDAEPSLDIGTKIAHISGLDDYSLPRPNLKLKAASKKANAVPLSGSAPGGGYAGNDFRAAYVPGTTLTGAGQSVGLLQFDGYHASDIAAYRTQFGLPNIPLVNIAVNGGVSTPGDNNAEVCLDIEMAMSMAPGLSVIYVYEAPNPSPWVSLLSKMANDNLAKQLGCSWAGGSPSYTAETIFQQMAAQGQSFFAASGDSNAFTGSVPFPSDSPNITIVGGTTLTMSGTGNSYVSETVWRKNGTYGSSGGVSTYYSIPTWQQGISMALNQGSTIKRDIPDVALTADNVYVRYNNGGAGNFGGTSCAAPLWAGFIALVNQRAVANGLPTVGFINPAIYNIGKGASYNSAFHDTTTGNNYSAASPSKYSAVTGYDLCTGWGSPKGTALIDALADPADLLRVSRPTFSSSGPTGGPFAPALQAYTLTNAHPVNSLSWTAAASEPWISVSPAGGTLAAGASATVTVAFNSSAAALATGSYSGVVNFVNATWGIVHPRTVSLAVGQPDYFTELFTSGNDTDNQSWLFTPDGSASFYSVQHTTGVSAFPTDPTGGLTLSPSDGGNTQIMLTGGNTVNLYGATYSSFYVSSNGYITFGSGSFADLESLWQHFYSPCISALFDDLDSSSQGSVSRKQLSDRVAVTWQNVPQYGTSDSNNFQIELFFDGRIRITCLGIAATDGLIGLSQGLDTPTGFTASDFSAYPTLLLSVPAVATEGDGVLAGQGTVTLFSAPATDRVVTLASNNTAEVIVPATVTIPAGQLSATFDVTIVDDAFADGTQCAILTASESGFSPAAAVVSVQDNDVGGTLTLTAPSSTTEGAGSVQGTVAIASALVVPMPVTLSSSNTTAVQAPATVVIPAGQTSAAFPIAVVDDNKIDGAQVATLTAHVLGWTDGSATINVLDDENTNLTLSVPASISEGGTGAGTVSISGTLGATLTVFLSSNSSRLTLPGSVSIPAGSTSADFTLTASDNAVADGSPGVSITASASGFTGANGATAVLDDDVHHFTIDPIASPQIRGAPFSVTITAKDASGLTIADYAGSASLSASGNPVTPATITAFTNGVWTGNVTVNAFGTGVVLMVNDGSGHFGASNAFDLVVGPLHHFAWNNITIPQNLNTPFSATITAQDAGNNTVPGFNGTAALSGYMGVLSVIITEINPNTPNEIEFMNVGTDAVDVSGWQVYVYDEDAGWPNPKTVFTIPANTTCAAGQIFRLQEFGAAPGAFPEFYYGSSINWTSDGASHIGVLLRDASGTPVDFVCAAAATASAISSPQTVPASMWSGAAVAAPGNGSHGYLRVGNSDTNTAAGWTTDSSSMGTANTGLIAPFAGSGAVSISPASASFAGGVWTGDISVNQSATRMKLRADDGAGHIGDSNAFDAIDNFTITATYNSAADIPLTSPSFTATGYTVNFTLNFTPTTGANLTVVKNTGPGFIGGVFNNLAQGQGVVLSYGGVNYKFVANYFGGNGNDLVLQWADNRPVGWGANSSGQLGNNSTTNSSVPVAVNTSNVLFGKTVIASAAGGSHSLALCSDGTLAAWGDNDYGQLGNNSTTDSDVPVAVNASGVLSGKTVVAIAAGGSHSLALCSDGTLAAWGRNSSGQLGNNSTTDSSVPVAVNTSGVLSGKTVVAIAAGGSHSLALCSDGTLAAWGRNFFGQLGNNSTTDRSVPVAVIRTAVFFGKTVVAIAAGESHSLALCSDGTLAAWGGNYFGQLGNNSTTDSHVPVAVNASGVLSGKTVVAIATGSGHSLALCSDGTLAAWGSNSSGQLGNNSTTNSSVPVAVNTSGVLSGKTVIAIAPGWGHSLALCSDGALAAWGRNAEGQLGNNSTINSSVPVAVDTSALAAGEVIAQTAGGALASHSLGVVAMPPQPRILVQQPAGNQLISGISTVNFGPSPLGIGVTRVFTILNDGAPPLTISDVTLDGANAADFAVTTLPASPVAAGASTPLVVTFTPRAIFDRNAALHISSNDPNTANFGVNLIGTGTPPLAVTYDSASDIPITASSYTATGGTINFTLNFVPATGTSLTVVKITGQGFIEGVFDNLAQGQSVLLSYGGVNYHFVANYHGGSGNDLVLQWANSRSAAWGWNFSGQLGNSSTTDSHVPVANYTFNVLSGKTVTAIAAGWGHSLALCSDGTLAAWGWNFYGQLGNNSTTDSSAPVAVDISGVLSGKTIIAIAAGGNHSLALCSDGTLAAWGWNTSGQLGDNSTANSSVPVAVDTSGVLSGKTIVAIAAGGVHSLALCSDGTLAAWGDNNYGQLGNNSTTDSSAPVAVDTSGVLSGKTIVAIAAGNGHSFALCSDGTLAAWGDNNYGQLGNNSTTDSSAPVAVDISGVLSGKTIIAIAAGGNHSLALCSDGTLAAWGYNVSGQLGNNSTTNSSAPVAVNTSGVLSGKTVTAIAAGSDHSLAFCSDGTLAAWGRNAEGQLGNNSAANSSVVPVAVDTSGLLSGKTVVTIAAWGTHNLALCSDGTLAAWGGNTYGQLGDNSTTNRKVPVAASTSYGVLFGKTVTAIATGGSHSLALCSDGTLAAWGWNSAGQLGNNSTADNRVPVAVDTSGVLSGKTVVAIAAGQGHSLALCSNGTVAAWGLNSSGQLGNNSTAASSVPVAVSTSGVLSGKTVVAIAAGQGHSLALCSNGTVAAWGWNSYGQLGNGVTINSSVPVAVYNAFGALSGKTVVAIAAGQFHSLALCSDGTLAAWGLNSYGQLGNNSTAPSSIPVAVNTSGVLSGKTIVAISGGANHSLALCSDGTVAAWGNGGYGQLGNGSTGGAAPAPVAVDTSGVLSGKTVVAISGGANHSLASCSDGTVAAWGRNNYGQLGNNSTTDSKAPVAVDTSLFAPGERFLFAASGPAASHNLAVIAEPPYPVVATLATTAVTATSATLNGMVNANSNDTAVSFDYGPTLSYGSNVASATGTVTGNVVTEVSAALTGLAPGTTYHFRVWASNVVGAANGVDLTFTTLNNDAKLSALALSSGTLSPPFSSLTTSYTAGVSYATSSVTVTPTASDANATIEARVNGGTFSGVASGGASAPLALNTGANPIEVKVTAQDGMTTSTYSIALTRALNYTAWAAAYGMSGPNSGPAESYLGDGVPNLIKYAFGINPIVPGGLGEVRVSGATLLATGGPVVLGVPDGMGGTNHFAMFARRMDWQAAGLIYTVEFSADLAMWVSSSDTPTSVANNGTMEAVTVPYPLLINGQPPHFFRVRVGAP